MECGEGRSAKIGWKLGKGLLYGKKETYRLELSISKGL